MSEQEFTEVGDGTVLIPLTRGFVARVDEEDLDLVLFGGSWSLAERREKNVVRRYAQAFIDHEMILMHKRIMPPPSGLVVDHINGNGLDNRRSNLRFATFAQNAVNQVRPPGASGFRGVYRDGIKWTACSKTDGKKFCIGRFDTPEEAAVAYDEWMRDTFGEFARFNFPRPGERGVFDEVPEIAA
jgi:hypothetical protein